MRVWGDSRGHEDIADLRRCTLLRENEGLVFMVPGLRSGQAFRGLDSENIVFRFRDRGGGLFQPAKNRRNRPYSGAKPNYGIPLGATACNMVG